MASIVDFGDKSDRILQESASIDALNQMARLLRGKPIQDSIHVVNRKLEEEVEENFVASTPDFHDSATGQLVFIVAGAMAFLLVAYCFFHGCSSQTGATSPEATKDIESESKSDQTDDVLSSDKSLVSLSPSEENLANMMMEDASSQHVRWDDHEEMIPVEMGSPELGLEHIKSLNTELLK